MSRYNRQSTRALHTGSKAWRQIRARVLAEQPLCAMCQQVGLITPAEHVDHRDENSHNNARENLVGLCARHHSAKTAAAMRGKDVVLTGCGVDGVPYSRAKGA